MELDDCGKELLLGFNGYDDKLNSVTPIMVIKAPRGTMALFKPDHVSGIYDQYVYDRQAVAIKAFMEEHTNE